MKAARDQGSFRDPSGNIFTREGVVYRRVSYAYRGEYDHLMNSGLYDVLVDSGLLVRHQEVALRPAITEDAYRILQPEAIPFISYPYEWSFSQLKDAALATLEVEKAALGYGMTLKDASAFNIQFFKGRPSLIDTLSFARYKVGETWAAYRQFCQHFLAPLALMAHKHIGTGQLLRSYIDGIPLELASALLPMRTRLKPSMQMHIHLHARLQRKFAGRTDIVTRHTGSFSLRSFLGLIDSLESAVKGLQWRRRPTEWTEYYEGDSYSPEALQHKTELVTRFLKDVEPKTVWDLGANTGRFSRLASDMAIQTVSFDRDAAAVEESYITTVNRRETNLLPLLLDLTNPSPRIGWANRERMDLAERGPADMLFALALTHHLAIADNVPLDMIAGFFRELCTWAVVEFVPKSDKQVKRLLATREDVFPTYTVEHFEKEFGAFFHIKSKQRLRGAERTVYLMRGR